MKSFLFILFMSCFTFSFSQENKLKVNLYTEVLKEVYIFTTESKYILNKKSSITNGSSFSTKGVSQDQPSYFISSSFFNHRVNERITISLGHRYLENFTFKTSNSSISVKVKYRLIK